MTRFRGVALVCCAVLAASVCLLSFPGQVVQARQLTIPAHVADILRMNDAELELLDQQPAEALQTQAGSDEPTMIDSLQDQSWHHEQSLAETKSEAEVEAEVEAEAQQTPTVVATAVPVVAAAVPTVTATTVAPSPELAAEAAAAFAAAAAAAATAANAAAATTAANAAAAATAAATSTAAAGPVLPMETAAIKLARSRLNITQLERTIAKQGRQVAKTDRSLPRLSGEPNSSGAKYFQDTIQELKSSAGIVVQDTASALTQADARCVICQYVVQQAMGLLVGHPLTTGGAMAGGKRAAFFTSTGGSTATSAAPAADAAADDTASAAAFVEFDTHVHGGPSRRSRRGSSRQRTRPSLAQRRLVRASRAAARRSPGQDIGGRTPNFGRARPPKMGHNLRNVARTTYPVQLNDWGFDENARNRRADILAHRPRQARYGRGQLKKFQAKWDETRAAYQKLYGGVYSAFEKLCSKRMPLAYSGYCTEMMRDYRYIAQGIQSGDRAQSICMNGNWCDRKSYIRHAVHAYFVRESGDN